MNYKPLPLSFARCLLRLQNGEQLYPSEIMAKRLLKQFYDDGIIKKKLISPRRYFYYCSSPETLKNYLIVQNDILSLQRYILLFEEGNSDGENSLIATKSTKTFRNRSLQGFFVKTLNSKIMVSGKVIPSLPRGVEFFVHEPKRLKIPETTLIVGIENPECFIKIDKLLHLFPAEEIVFVMRYLSNSPNRWLQTIPNNYLHFGDFDPAGIGIYIREFRENLSESRCSFFLPPDIEQLVEIYGLTSLFDQQIFLLKNIDFDEVPELKDFAQFLLTVKKGMEQERLLKLA